MHCFDRRPKGPHRFQGGNCTIILPGDVEDFAGQQPETRWRRGIEPQRLLDGGDRLRGLPGIGQYESEVSGRFGVIGVERCGTAGG